jgi:hypothetical protein
MTRLSLVAVMSIVTVLFFSCKDPNEYRVDAAFAGYLQRFEDSAAVRGKNFDLQGGGLIMEFANLKDNTAGLTHYENPIRIEFDRDYWNQISNNAGSDLMKEDLVFHELGHGLLNRKHLNTTLENGDWKSIMCGGDKANGRSWNINYKGMRRLYYINELFKESTPAPDFSSNQFVADSSGYTPKLKLSFDDAANAGWRIVDTTSFKTSLENGRMRFESKTSKILMAFFPNTNINVQSDFSYELNMEYSSNDLTGQFGIVFGNVPNGSTGSTDPVEYFTIDKNKNMYMGNRTWYSYFTQLLENQIKPAAGNKLKVFKSGNMLYYFVNNVYSYCSEIETKVAGTQYGFVIPAKGVLYLDNLVISQRSYSGASQKTIINQPVEFDCVAIESLNQGLIKR